MLKLCGGLNFVDVRDVAIAVVNSINNGDAGERYLLGACNQTMNEFIKKTCCLLDQRTPILKVSKKVTWLLSKFLSPLEKTGILSPMMEPVSIEMGSVFWYFDSSKASKKIGFTPRDPEITIIDTLIDLMEKDLGSNWYPLLQKGIQSKLICEDLIPSKSNNGDIYLITGATGCIGMRLIHRLIKEGKKIRALVLKNDPKIKELPLEVDVVIGDVCDMKSVCKALDGVSTVFHLAAIVGDWGKDSVYNKVNVFGTYNVLSQAAALGVHCLLSSSIVVYGDQLNNISCPESTSYGRSLGPYSRTKIEQEKIAWLLHNNSGLALTVIRPSNIYGPGSQPWVIDTLKQIKSRFPSYVGSGKGNAGLCHVDNVVELFYIASLKKDKSVGEVFNCCDELDITWKMYFNDLARIGKAPKPWSIPSVIAKLIAFVLEPSYKLFMFSNRPAITFEVLNLVDTDTKVPMDKAKEELGYSKCIDYKKGLESIREFHEVI